MEKTEIKGWFSYRGVACMQTADVADKVKKLLTSTNPNQVLEIGTASGGMTLLIRDLLNELGLTETTLRSYDIRSDFNRTELLKEIKQGGAIDFRLKNIFNHQYSELEEAEEVTEYIHRPGTTVVMCDGGSKKDEFRILSPLLKPGDIIMAHDYAANNEYFEKHIKDVVWNWHEIQDTDIEPSCLEHKLEPYLQEEFAKVVWACRRKLIQN